MLESVLDLWARGLDGVLCKRKSWEVYTFGVAFSEMRLRKTVEVGEASPEARHRADQHMNSLLVGLFLWTWECAG